MTNILHITPHLGGGVGRVLGNYIAYSQANEGLAHRVLCLEHANETARDWASSSNVPLHNCVANDMEFLIREVSDADVVLIHWWNHPLLMALLVRETLPAARVVMWSHVAGHTPPQVFSQPLVLYPDRFVLATPYSYQAPTLQGWHEALERVRVVFTSAGIEHVRDVQPKPHEGFRVGYIGTVDACKLHPDFLRLSAAARIPNVQFVVCGGDRHRELSDMAARLGIGDRFHFLGPVRDVREQLASFDVFGYPLHRQHYGTGEQVLIEAMAAGVPPVVLGPGAESHVVHHGVDGLVLENLDEYGPALEELWRDGDRRRQLGDNARRTARREYTIERTASAWREVLDEVLAQPKRIRSWVGRRKGQLASGADLFCESLGKHASDFLRSLRDDERRHGAEARIAQLPYLFRTPTRGTPFHYRRFFPADPHLCRWCNVLSQEGRDHHGGWNESARQHGQTETQEGSTVQ